MRKERSLLNAPAEELGGASVGALAGASVGVLACTSVGASAWALVAKKGEVSDAKWAPMLVGSTSHHLSNCVLILKKDEV